MYGQKTILEKKLAISASGSPPTIFNARGCEILEMNFENKFGYRLGEIDVVARDPKNNELIFAEVKTRQKGNQPFGIARTRHQPGEIQKAFQNNFELSAEK